MVEAFCVKKYREGKMTVSVQSGLKDRKDETLVIMSKDSQLVLKTMSEDDYKSLKDNIANYYSYIKLHPNTLLSAILGVFSLHFPWHLCIEPLHFFVSQAKIKANVPGQVRFMISVLRFITIE